VIEQERRTKFMVFFIEYFLVECIPFFRIADLNTFNCYLIEFLANLVGERLLEGVISFYGGFLTHHRLKC
jgi:hypothetical protein